MSINWNGLLVDRQVAGWAGRPGREVEAWRLQRVATGGGVGKRRSEKRREEKGRGRGDGREKV